MGRKSRLKREKRLRGQANGQKRLLQETFSNIEKIYLTIIRWGIYFILFIPFIVRKEFIFPFVFPKSTVFQITIEVIFAFWILLALRNSRFRPHFWKNPKSETLNPKQITKPQTTNSKQVNVLGLTLALFVGINIIASLTGVDFLRSFWSTQERMTGIFALLHLFCFFTILITCFKTRRSWKRFFDVVIVSAVLVSLYALGQKLGLGTLIASGERLTGTIGNPSFLASWLLFGAFFSLWGVIRGTDAEQNAELTQKWIWRLGFYLPSFVFISTILIFTGGRGPFFAFGLGLFLFGLVLAIFSRNKITKRIAITGLLLVIILGAGLFLMRNTSWVKSNPYLNRYASVFSGELYPTIKGRIIVWDMAFRSWGEKPLLGWGPENYNIAFNKYLEPELGITDIVWYDRVHNIILDTLNTTGIIGLLSYLGIFVVAIWSLLKLSFNKLVEAKLHFTIPVIILICYFIQNFFVFDMINTYIMFFLLLSFISLITAKQTQNITPVEEQSSLRGTAQNRRKTYEPVHWGRIFAVGFLTIILIYAANIRPAQASFYGIKGGIAMLGKNYTLALGYYKKAFSYNNFTQGEIAKEFTKMIEKDINDPDFAPHKEKILKLAIEELEKVYKNHPDDVAFAMLLGKLYNLGSQFDTSYLEKAEIVIAKALELSPKRQRVYWLAGQNKLLLGKNEGAVDLFKKALYLDPRGSEQAKAFWYLGVALNSTEEYEEALTKLSKAQDLGYQGWKNVPSITFLAEVNIKAENPKEALKYYERALKLEPENVSIQKRIEEIQEQISN